MLYGIGISILLLRFYTRIKSVGFRGLQGDDYFSILVIVFWTMDAVTVHIIYHVGTNIEASSIIGELTAQQLDDFAYGSSMYRNPYHEYVLT